MVTAAPFAARFAAPFARRDQPGAAPWRLALGTRRQYTKDRSDRAAADAVRSRIEWMYLRGLELMDAGFDASVVRECRGRLVAGGTETCEDDQPHLITQVETTPVPVVDRDVVARVRGAPVRDCVPARSRPWE